MANGAKLDAMFALHPALATTAGLYQQGQALFAHAIASPYRDRSHFDGQNVLETGGSGAYQLKDGWLNRLLGVVPTEVARAIAVIETGGWDTHGVAIPAQRPPWRNWRVVADLNGADRQLRPARDKHSALSVSLNISRWDARWCSCRVLRSQLPPLTPIRSWPGRRSSGSHAVRIGLAPRGGFGRSRPEPVRVVAREIEISGTSR